MECYDFYACPCEEKCCGDCEDRYDCKRVCPPVAWEMKVRKDDALFMELFEDYVNKIDHAILYIALEKLQN